ncbi:hypothetical protein SADUNF_Sadunf19G0085000 [Salix dunnii]|uniref:B30.2/SPRY domain-containing protein n=1 Tax=Salix dunnii TaxID=1413687 RepID=A0A835MFF9_9ROSI|nr:hypothetical protein SADUNF_Sadunf19G0085000 [Salix dunnii]
MSSITTNKSPTTNSTAINSNSKNGSNQDPGSYFVDVARQYSSPIGEETELEPKELNTVNSSGGFIVVSTDKLSIKYPGVSLHGHDVGVIQADKPVPEKRLVYYFEIFVKNAGAKGQIAIGFTPQSFKMRRQPGWETNSCGYHGDDGNLYTGNGKGDAFGPTFTTNDTVGAGINYASQEFFFTKNGDIVGAVYKNMKGPLFPTVAVHSQNEEQEAMKQISAVDKISLPPNISYKLVRSYLLHYGYEATLNAFDVASNNTIPPIYIAQENGSGEQDIAYALTHRKTLRQLIRNGEIDAALSNLRDWYPQIMQDEKSAACFLLHCQKFIELVRVGALGDAVTYGKIELAKFFKLPPFDDLVRDCVALLAYEQPEKCSAGYLLEDSQREIVADAVNALILSTDPNVKDSQSCLRSHLERLLRQLTVCCLERRSLNGDQGEANTSQFRFCRNMTGARLTANVMVLLVLGAVFLGAIGGDSIAKACPLYCLDVDYMTCKSSAVHKRKSRNTKLPQGKTGWPIIGETWDFMMAARCGTPEKFINDRVSKYSPEVFQTSLLGHNMAVFCGSGGNKFLYSSENKCVTGWLPQPLVKILFSPERVVNSYKEESAKLRKFLPELLKPEPLQHFIPVMDSMAKDHLKADWFKYKQVKVFPLSKTYTFALACRLFMKTMDPEHVSRLQNHFNLVTKGILSIPLNFPGTAYNRAIKGGNMIRAEILAIMEDRRRELVSESKEPEFIDILSRMLLVKDENGNPMDDMEIVDRVVGLLFGSHDTTSASISMVMYYLADNPHVYMKVLREHMEIQKLKAPGEFLTWNDTQKMKYTWCVVCEVMRLSPPGHGGFREAISDFSYADFTIPKGWKVFWSVHSTHKNPKYFRDPEKFDPSRFERNDIEPYSFVPFGGGPRMCPGKEYARLAILTKRSYTCRFRCLHVAFRLLSILTRTELIFSRNMTGARPAANAMVLLLLGVVLLGAFGGDLIAKACPQYCLDVDYMTCKSSGDKKLDSACNCCLAPKNCTLHLADGSLVQC